MSVYRRDRRTTVGWKVIRRNRHQALDLIESGTVLIETRVNLRDGNPAPRLEPVPPVGKAGLEIKQRVFLRSYSSTEVKDARALLRRPATSGVNDQAHGRQPQKRIAGRSEMILDDAIAEGEQAAGDDLVIQ